METRNKNKNCQVTTEPSLIEDINNGRNTTFNNAVDFLGDVTLFKDVTSVKIITDEIGSSSGQLNISSDVNITGTASVKEVFEKVNQRKETSGTKNIDKRIYSNGGRVLNFVVKSESFKKNRVKAIELINKLRWNYGFFRKDIGFKVID